MWIFYYKSEERIRQIANKIDPNIPVEKKNQKKQKWEAESWDGCNDPKIYGSFGITI